MTPCPHDCDADGWIGTDTGLMPCPRHQLDAHERWSATAARKARQQPTGPRPRTPAMEAALAAAREALTRPRRNQP